MTEFLPLHGVAARRLIRKLHPDIAPGHEARIALVMEAQEVLTNPDKRRRYDEHRRLRKLEQERLRRAQEAAAAAAQAAAERAAAEEAQAAGIAAHERRVAEEGRWGVAEEHAPEAPRGTPSTPNTFSATFSWTAPVDRSAIRGQDHVITVTGHQGCFHEGFRFTAKSDGELVLVRAGLRPGVYVFEGRGWFAPSGGPRGDRVMHYSWPPPLRGADLHISVGRRG